MIIEYKYFKIGEIYVAQNEKPGLKLKITLR